MLRRLGSFFRLTRRQQRLLVEAGSLVLAYRLGLACLPSAVVLRRGERSAGLAALAAGDSGAERAELVWALTHASRCVPGARCLAQALAARQLFARHGLSSSVRFGGRKKPDGSLEAHAWVESGGSVVYGEAHPGEFTPMVKVPVPGPPGSAEPRLP